MENNLSVQRASPGGHLGSQAMASGRRPSTSQGVWTPAGKRKGRGSRGSPGSSPVNQGKKYRGEEWVWEQ